MVKKRRALYIGRFQPYHLGHHRILQTIAEETEELIVCIGSAQISHDLKNPFTAGERVLMVTSAIREFPVKSYVIPIMDIERNAIWVSHLVSLTPPFEVVYSNNPLVRRLFTEAGFEVRGTPLYRRDLYSGTEIRRRILAGERWEHLVPEVIVEIIRACDGIRRIQDLSERDTGE